MKMVYPDYNNGLINIISSVEKYFGVTTNHKSLKKLDKILKDNNPNNIVLALFDGFGYEQLETNKDICPFMHEHLVSSVSSTFPSTTMAARTTIESGLNPIEHGWLGWDMYFKDLNEVVCLAKNTIKETNKKAANYNVAKTLLSYEPVVDKINKTGVNAIKVSVYSNHKDESLFKMRLKIKLTTLFHKRNYVYAYFNEPDHVFHRTGTKSLDSRLMLIEIEKHFKKLCKTLKNTTVIAVADHGHIDSNYITLSDYPKVFKMLERIISIDNRAVSFFVKKGYKKEFEVAIKEIIKDDFILKTKEEVIKEHLYGEGNENKCYRDALGDYFAIGVGDKAIRYTNKTKEHKSSHSGLTTSEMLVPLIIVNKK